MSDLQFRYVTVPQLADALDTKPGTIYEQLQAYKLPAEKVGRSWLIRRNDAVLFCRIRRDEHAEKAATYDRAIERLAA